MKVRIQKHLSEKGILSRRKTEDYIKKGWILVNGKVVTEMGVMIDPRIDKVTISEKGQKVMSSVAYLAFHKPRGVVTNLPQRGEEEIRHLLPNHYKHLSSIGRLDKESEGLILLTDDGVFAKKMLDSKRPHEREYEVTLDEGLTGGMIQKLEKGMTLFGEKTKPLKIKFTDYDKRYNITMTEGKNRQIRRMMQKVGREVIELKRIRFGPLCLGNLPVGKFKVLTPDDILSIIKSSR